mmetsp:Transcript_20077/g.29524  ORF Transcript_20077/g.29524 Transcript_20077/m.29524 type:complete len:144 (+) Transcript_20077:1-432(+)
MNRAAGKAGTNATSEKTNAVATPVNAVVAPNDDTTTTTFSTSDTTTVETTKLTIPTCANLEHEVWSCRSTALACGKDLMVLRDCFREQNDPDNHNNEKKGDRQCKMEQSSLGACVTKKAKELEVRLKDRKRNKKASISGSSAA